MKKGIKKIGISLIIILGINLYPFSSGDLPIVTEVDKITAAMTMYNANAIAFEAQFNQIIASFRELSNDQQFNLLLNNHIRQLPNRILNGHTNLAYEIENQTKRTDFETFRLKNCLYFFQRYARLLEMYNVERALNLANQELEKRYAEQLSLSAKEYTRKLESTATALEDHQRQIEKDARAYLKLNPRYPS